ncbi:Protein of uncharacterised function (DUF2767) [Citrobacter amalonaticus]|nr:Protein of uncharacterised function (DUF2767) [Citrobacter amalonaticus]
MGNLTKDDELYREMCRVVGKVVLEMRDLGQEPKHIVIAGVLRTALANQRIQRSDLEKQANGNGNQSAGQLTALGDERIPYFLKRELFRGNITVIG